MLINYLNLVGSQELSVGIVAGLYLDPNEDGSLTPADVLFVINVINYSTLGNASAAAEGEGGVVVSGDPPAAYAAPPTRATLSSTVGSGSLSTPQVEAAGLAPNHCVADSERATDGAFADFALTEASRPAPVEDDRWSGATLNAASDRAWWSEETLSRQSKRLSSATEYDVALAELLSELDL